MNISKKHLENRKKWVAALRSGKYEQGRGSLKYKDEFGVMKYCCLGVFCEIMNIPNSKNSAGSNYLFKYKNGEPTSGQPDGRMMSELVNLESNPKVSINNKIEALTALNDYELLSFTKIADIIEKEMIKPYETKKTESS